MIVFMISVSGSIYMLPLCGGSVCALVALGWCPRREAREARDTSGPFLPAAAAPRAFSSASGNTKLSVCIGVFI